MRSILDQLRQAGLDRIHAKLLEGRRLDFDDGMRLYQTLGLVWFDIAHPSGRYEQNWRIDDSPAALTAFRRGASTLALSSP